MKYQLPILKHWLRLLIKQWFKSCVFVTFLCLILTCSLWFYNRRPARRGNVIHGKQDTRTDNKVFYVDYTKADEVFGYAFSKATNLHTCPACLGKGLCRNLIKDESNVQEILDILKKPGYSEDKEVWFDYTTSDSKKQQIGIASLKDWLKYEMFICQNASQLVGCKISNAIPNTILNKNEFISENSLLNLHRVVNKMRSDLPLLLCSTEKLIVKLIKAFDEDGNGLLNQEEQLAMFTSLLVQPSYALMKLHSSGGLMLPVPRAVGACGRLVVREAGWTSLTESLKEPFEVRAGLALQLLQSIEDFQDEDSEWYILNTDFSYDSLMVTKDGEVVLSNLQDVALVDKSLFAPRSPNVLESDGDLCNEACFQKFTREILEGKNVTRGVCSRIPQYGQLMYALACKQLLSDLDEHKSEGVFNFDGNRIHKVAKYQGLLHNIPERDKENIEDLLRECVQETSSGGRKQAIEELREILEKYLNYDDDDDDDDEDPNNHNESDAL